LTKTNIDSIHTHTLPHSPSLHLPLSLSEPDHPYPISKSRKKRPFLENKKKSHVSNANI